MALVKTDVATGRDNVPGSILCFLPEVTQTRLYYAVVERLAGREDAQIRDWAEFDVCLVSKRVTSRTLTVGDPFPWFDSVQLVRDLHVESVGQRTQTASESAVWVQTGSTMPGHCLFLGGKFAQS